MKIWGALNFLLCSAIVVQLSLHDEGFSTLTFLLWAILSAEVLLVSYFVLGIYTMHAEKESQLLDEDELKKTSTIELPITYNVFSTLMACCFVFIGLLLLANKESEYNGNWPLMPAAALNLALFNILVSFGKREVEQKSDLTTD